MKKDLKNLTLFELKEIIQKENDRQGYVAISIKGKKEDLIYRLENYELPDDEEGEVGVSNQKYLSNERLQKLKEGIERKLAGKGQFYFLLEQADGSSTVELHGGARGKWSQTLLVADHHILKVVNAYIQRAAVGTDGASSKIM